MLTHNTPNMRSFASNVQAIVPIILHHHYSHIFDHSQHQIAINKLSSVAQPLIVPIEKADNNCIPLEDFLVLLDEKLLQEKTYIEEIMQFKESFCGEFDRLCEGVSDKKLLIFIRNQRQRIIDCVFDLLKFEKRQIITKFYDNMMSGYDDEAMKEFEKIVCNTLWKPFLTPLPLGLAERIKNAVEEIKNEKSEKNIEEIASRMILFVNEHFKNKQFKLSNFASATDLKSVIVELIDARKICSIGVDDTDEKKLNLIQEFKSKCIKSISINLGYEVFEKGIFNFVFNDINFLTQVNTPSIKTVSEKLPRVLKSLNQRFANATNVDLDTMKANLVNLNSLTMLALNFSDNKNAIGDSGMLSISHLINQNKRLKKLNLNFRGNENTITDTGLIRLSLEISKLLELNYLELIFGAEHTSILGSGVNALSKSFQNMININHLCLGFANASIPTDAIDNLAISIIHMSQIEFLALGFGGGTNDANNNSIQLFAQAIIQMLNLIHLNLLFWGGKHQITDDGIMRLAQSITRLTKIQHLELQFGSGNNGVSGKAIDELSRSIANFSNLQNLNLRFFGGNHCIEDTTIQNLGISLMQNQKLTKLCLDFGKGNNKVSDKGMQEFSKSIATLKNLQNLDLLFPGGNNCVGDDGIEELSRSIANFQNLQSLELTFWHGNHRISDKGMQALAAALKKANKVTNLYFDFDGGNSITDASMIFLADALKQMPPSLTITMDFQSSKSSRVTTKGESIIRNARTYNSITFVHNGQEQK